jgi:hypothetical protein
MFLLDGCPEECSRGGLRFSAHVVPFSWRLRGMKLSNHTVDRNQEMADDVPKNCASRRIPVATS